MLNLIISYIFLSLVTLIALFALMAFVIIAGEFCGFLTGTENWYEHKRQLDEDYEEKLLKGKTK